MNRSPQKIIGMLAGGLIGVTALCPEPCSAQQPPPPVSQPPAAVSNIGATSLSLNDLINLSMAQHPALQQAALNINVAQGRVVQAGLYPNPTLTISGEEINPKAGIVTMPQISQEIVTANKLGLATAVALRDMDQAQLALVRQRYALMTLVRQSFFEVLAVQRRIKILGELEEQAKESVARAQKLREGRILSEADVLQFEIDLERLRAEQFAAKREELAAWGRLTATAGFPQLPLTDLRGTLEDPLPYDVGTDKDDEAVQKMKFAREFEKARAFVVEGHPEVQFARIGINRAQIAVQREEAEAIPNVTLGAGYQRNFNEREHQATFQISVPLPFHNRNQGNILSAQAEAGRAVLEVNRVQLDLTNRLWTAFGQYAAAKQRADRYRRIVPKTEQAYRQSVAGFRGAGLEYLGVLNARRALQEAKLEYLRAQAEAWRAASEIAGLLLEEPIAPTPLGK